MSPTPTPTPISTPISTPRSIRSRPAETPGAPDREARVGVGRRAASTALILASALAASALIVGPAAAQEITVDLGDESSLSARVIQLFLLVTVLSLAPGIAVMITCFPFMVTVLSILRTAIGLQQSPPNMLIVSLALVLTYYVMAPVFQDAWAAGVVPLMDGDITEAQAFDRIMGPFRAFMELRVDPDTVDELLRIAPGGEAAAVAAGEPTPLSVLVPSFMLSEIQRAFEIGFMIFLPFLIIDLAIASILMAMGMMMVPPSVVSLPFKLAFFVMADGWTLLASALVSGYT